MKALALPLFALPLLCTAQEAAPPRWELGGFALGVSQQAYPGADEQLQRGLVLPYLIYRGRYLRADGETTGLRALKTPRLEFDLGVAGAFGGGGEEIRARQGMQRLGTLVEAGPRLRWNLGPAPLNGRWRAVLPLRAVFDLSDDFRHRGWALEPELIYERRSQGGWRYGVGIGAIAGDRRLADTFYSVRSDQVLADRPAYTARAGLIAWRLQTGFSKPLNRDWRLFGFARIDSVAGAANRASPLVRQTVGASVGLGLSYTAMRSAEAGEE